MDRRPKPPRTARPAGWRARVDGQSVDVYRADYGLRAVPLEAGVHEIEFEYRPFLFYAGAVLSAATLLIVAVLFAVKARARDVSA